MDIVELFGRRALGRDRPEDYISWAVEQLAAGIESENLPILASMDFAKSIDPIEVRECFQQVTTELGLDWPNTGDCIKKYADFVCRRLIDGSMDSRTGVETLASMYFASDYKEHLYLFWEYLDEDISFLDSEHGSIFNYGLNNANVSDYVKWAAAQHLRLSKIELPSGFYRYCACQDCGLVAEAESVRSSIAWLPDAVYRALFRRAPTYLQRCSGCKSDDILPMTSFEGRKAYLDQLGTA